MSAFGLLRRLLLLLFLVASLQAAWNASQLPALSAIGFDLRVGADGEATFYLPTWQIMWLHVGAAAVLAAGFWLFPERWIDVPSSGRRPDPRDGLLRLATWLGIVTLLTLTALMQLVYDANRAAIPSLRVGAVAALLGAYVAFVAGWLWAWRHVRTRAFAVLDELAARDAARENARRAESAGDGRRDR
jgi:hypothetical protein